jgi:AcrR family transcriptional regulator
MPRINTEYREEAKRKIIAAALEVAADDGWGAVTLEAIAQKVGVTKGAFYSYFTNSSVLMQDVIITMIRRIRDHILMGLDGEEDLAVALDRLSDFIFLQPKPFIPMFINAISSMPRDKEFQQRISGLFDENSDLIVAALARYQKAGQIPDEVDLPMAARAIYSMTMGLGMMTHVLGKDPGVAKKTWVMAAERILMIRPRA